MSLQQMRRIVRGTVFTAVATGVLVASPAWAADAPGKPAGTPGAAAKAKVSADMVVKNADATASRYATAAPKVKEAADLLVAALKAQAAAQVKIGQATEAGDRDGVKAATIEATDLQKRVTALNEAVDGRVTEASMADTAPMENWKKLAVNAQAEYEAFFAARTKAGAAGAKLAELAVQAQPDLAAIDEAKDVLMEARNQASVLQRIAGFASDAAMRRAAAEKLNSPEYTKKIDEIAALEKQIIVELRKGLDAALAQRKIERMRRDATIAADTIRTTPAVKK